MEDYSVDTQDFGKIRPMAIAMTSKFVLVIYFSFFSFSFFLTLEMGRQKTHTLFGR